MLSRKDVQYTAELSRIHLKDEETERLTKTLADILKYIDQLKKLDIAGIKPTSHVLPIKDVFRDDTVRPSLKQEDALKFSVSQHKGSFKVPQVIE